MTVKERRGEAGGNLSAWNNKKEEGSKRESR